MEQKPENNKLDTIKEILFGEQIKDYSNSLAEMQQKIQSNKESVLEKLNEIKEKLTIQIEENFSKLNLQLTEFESKVEEELKKQDSSLVNKTEMSDLFNHLSKKLNG